ncbi:MAG TPA: energy-coupling factor ABC transporter ATP-binding protein [Gammaproteobacteria bacterium]|nr:energy-coupling factor ABC transporter ATP-binding protein [Gammaproteobacteria bacterium]
MNEPLISTIDLHHSFHNRGTVLAGANFQLFPGERIALTGANGAGKTTFLHLLVGLLKLRQGEIIAFGQSRKSEADFVEVRARAGLLFQDPDDQLFCPTVLEDVIFGPLNLGKSRKEALAIARDTLSELGMSHFESRVTHQLSGGEKRMITLASVLSMQPDALLLDEPSNALDDQAKARLIKTLQQLPQAMIIISHEQDFLQQLATRWVRLEEGKLISIPETPQAT